MQASLASLGSGLPRQAAGSAVNLSPSCSSPNRPHEKFAFGIALRQPSPPSRGAILRPHQPLSARLRRRHRGCCAAAAHDGTAAAAALVTGRAPPDPAATAAGRGGEGRTTRILMWGGGGEPAARHSDVAGAVLPTFQPQVRCKARKTHPARRPPTPPHPTPPPALRPGAPSCAESRHDLWRSP